MINRKYVIARVENRLDIYGLPYSLPDLKYVVGFVTHPERKEKWDGKGLQDTEGLPRIHKQYTSNPLRATHFSVQDDVNFICSVFDLISRHDKSYSFVVRTLESVI